MALPCAIPGFFLPGFVRWPAPANSHVQEIAATSASIATACPDRLHRTTKNGGIVTGAAEPLMADIKIGQLDAGDFIFGDWA
ncbi:MAG: hypothetical protein KL863_05495 [Rhizobium sp.]|nr:hypothetical protein [Rhizobium sp.]